MASGLIEVDSETFPDAAAVEGASLAIRLLRASGFATLGNIGSRALSFVAGVLAARLLSEADFGALGLIQSTVSVFGVVAGLSLGPAATRYVALYRARQPQRAREFMLLAFALATMTTVVAASVMAVAAPLIATRLGGNEALAEPLRWAALLLLATAGYGVVSGALAGLERFGTAAITVILQNATILVALALLGPRLGLTGAILANAIGLAAALSAGLWSVRALLRVRWDLGTWSRVGVAARREGHVLLEFCLPQFAGGLVTMPAGWISYLLIANQPGGYAELGFFTAADRFRLLLTFVAGFVAGPLLPILTQATVTGRTPTADARRGLEYSLAATVVLVLPLTSALAFAGPQVMALFGRSYEVNWSVLLPVIAWGSIGAIGSVIGTALIAYGKQWFLFATNTSLVICVLTLTYLLREFGGTGLALANLISVTAVATWSIPVMTRMRALTVRATVVVFSAMATIGVLCGASWVVGAQLRLLLAAPVTLLVFMAAAYLVPTAGQRRRLLAAVRTGARASGVHVG